MKVALNSLSSNIPLMSIYRKIKGDKRLSFARQRPKICTYSTNTTNYKLKQGFLSKNQIQVL